MANRRFEYIYVEENDRKHVRIYAREDVRWMLDWMSECLPGGMPMPHKKTMHHGRTFLWGSPEESDGHVFPRRTGVNIAQYTTVYQWSTRCPVWYMNRGVSMRLGVVMWPWFLASIQGVDFGTFFLEISTWQLTRGNFLCEGNLHKGGQRDDVLHWRKRDKKRWMDAHVHVM